MLILHEKAGPQYQLSTNTDISVPWVHSPTTSATLTTSPHQSKSFDKMEGPTAQPLLPEQQLAQHYSSISTYYPNGHICCTLTGSFQGDGMNATTQAGCTHCAEACWHTCHQIPACIPSDTNSFLNDPYIKKSTWMKLCTVNFSNEGTS